MFKSERTKKSERQEREEKLKEKQERERQAIQREINSKINLMMIQWMDKIEKYKAQFCK